MKKPHVLNRPMFNQGGTSAYGKGITSNLVSDEQRQRFNYGGRVRLAHGNPFETHGDRYYNPRPWEDDFQLGLHLQTLPKPIESDIYSTDSDTDWGTYSQKAGVNELLTEEGDIIADQEDIDIKQIIDPTENIRRREKKEARAEEAALAAQERMYPTEILEGEDEDLAVRRHKELPADPGSDVIDWTEFAEGLYDKKGAKGKALLGLAGNVLAASQQPKKEAAAILGKGIGDFGKTWETRKEKMEDIAATGKMYEQIYKTREETKGKQNLALAKWKADLLKTGTPSERYHAILAGQDVKASTIQDALYKASGSKIRAKIMPIDKKETKKILEDPENEGEIYIQDQTTFIIKGGQFKVIELEALLKTLK